MDTIEALRRLVTEFDREKVPANSIDRVIPALVVGEWAGRILKVDGKGEGSGIGLVFRNDRSIDPILGDDIPGHRTGLVSGHDTSAAGGCMGEAACDRIYDSIPAVSAHPRRAGRQLRNSRSMIAVCSLPFLFIGSIMPVDEAVPGGREVALTIYGATP